MEDDLYENLILLSFFQKIKEQNLDQNKYKQNNLKNLLDLFPKTDLNDYDLNKSNKFFYFLIKYFTFI